MNTYLGKHTQHQSPCFVLLRRMTEAAVESADVLLKSCDVTSCDVISCPSPPSCLSLCKQKEDEECHSDSKNLEQQVNGTKYIYCYVPHKNYAPPPTLPPLLMCSLYDKLCPHSQKHCNQVQPKKKVKVS